MSKDKKLSKQNPAPNMRLFPKRATPAVPIDKDLPEHATNRWYPSRYQMLDGMASEIQTLVEDALLEADMILRVLNRDVDFAVASHAKANSLAIRLKNVLFEARHLSALLGSDLDYMRMIASGIAKPLEKTGVQHED